MTILEEKELFKNMEIYFDFFNVLHLFQFTLKKNTQILHIWETFFCPVTFQITATNRTQSGPAHSS
jgi:hypothetical protein